MSYCLHASQFQMHFMLCTADWLSLQAACHMPLSNCLTCLQSGKRSGDAALGRYLADTLAAVPRLGQAEFERLFNDSMQDSLMVTYLANLMRAQVGFMHGLLASAFCLLRSSISSSVTA